MSLILWTTAAMVVTAAILIVFVHPDRTCKDGRVRRFPSLWNKFRSWPSKIEALDNVLAGKPADAPINRGLTHPISGVTFPAWEPMEQYEDVAAQYRARPPQWVSVETRVGDRPASQAELQQIINTMRPSAAELEMIANLAQQGQLVAAQDLALNGRYRGVSMGATVAPRNPKTPENFIKELNKKANEAANPKQPQSIDRFDKIEE